MGKGKEFRTTINIGGDIDPSVRAAIESMADRLEMLEGVADDAQSQLEELEKASKDLKGGFTIAKGAAADLVSSGIQAIAGAAKDAITGIYGLAESTREFRQDMGTLETAFDRAGFSADTATETWKGLYSVFGEDDRAVEAANNIARMADSQEELDEWVRITTGVWGTYQDALPVEGLAEAAGETAKVGMAIATGQTTAAAVATNALGVATKFLFSPLTIAITVIAALTAGVIWLYNNWDTAKEHLIAFGNKVSEIWNSIAGWITGAIETISQYFPVFGAFLDGVWQSIQDVVGNIKAIFGGVIDFISNIFAGNWGAAWQNIVDIFGNIFGMIMNIAKAPINGVISIVNKAINAINSIGFDVPDWVPLIGGKGFHINIPNIPLLATGGFTNGPSIAGEAGTEAVISFDPAYRAQNLAYWAKAGRMLGADEDGTSFSLSGGSSGGDVNLGGVTFAPNITVTGQADKESIMDAIEAEYPEFIDMLEAWFAGRGKPVYG